jgi:hypothetical protein
MRAEIADDAVAEMVERSTTSASLLANPAAMLQA